jgi:YHS domain-containing protein
MAIDPVCKTEVDEKAAVHRSFFQGKTFYFSSAECKRQFDESPEIYGTVRSEGGFGESESLKEKAGGKGKEFFEKGREKAKSLAVNQKGKAAEGIERVAQSLRSTAKTFEDHSQIGISRYADQIAGRMEVASHYVRDTEIEQIIDDAESAVRNRPAMVLGAAFAAGLLLARFLKSTPGHHGYRSA